MSNNGGVFRFISFLAVVLLLGTGYYAMRLKAENDQLHASVTTGKSAHDALELKLNGANKDLADANAKLKQAQDQVAELQAQIEAAAKKPARRGR